MIKKVKLYTKGYCPFCQRVTSYLKEKGISFEEIDITNDLDLYEEVKNQTGHNTVPIVFIDGEFIGGSTEFFDYINENDL